MPIITLTDSNFKSYIGDAAALILISDGSDKLRSDFKTAFDKAADEEDGIVFGRVDPSIFTKLAARFDYQNRSLLIGLYRGETLFRRSRPWASDLPDYHQPAARGDRRRSAAGNTGGGNRGGGSRACPARQAVGCHRCQLRARGDYRIA